MKKRISAAAVCLLLVFASGCELFPVPSGTSAAQTTPPAATEAQSTPLPGTAAATQQPTQASTEAPTGASSEAPTQAPTEAPAGTPAASKDATSTEGMIFPKSGAELLMWKDLITLDAEKLDLARNEIFARRGYKFTKQSYTDYFSKFAWYAVDENFSQSDFTETEAANIHLIQAAEKALAGLLFEVTSGLKLDYDQDGELETLTFDAPDDSHMKVSIKHGSATAQWNIDCMEPIKKVFLGDIDLEDKLLDIFVGQRGFSDDYSVHAAGVKHKAFLQRGEIPGTINSGSDKNPFKLNGKGQITTLERIDTVGTDFFVVRYRLSSSGKLAFYPLASYNFIKFEPTNYTVKTKVELKLKKKNESGSAVAFTVPAGATVTLLSTDTKKWVKIKTSEGEGWLELAERLKVKDPNIATWDAFDGLIMAG